MAAYRWRAKAGKEDQFRSAWRRGTELIRAKYGSLGSRLHRDRHGNFIGVAEWPDEATWQRAFDAQMKYDEPSTRQAFVDSLEDWDEEPLLLMTVTDDLLNG